MESGGRGEFGEFAGEQPEVGQPADFDLDMTVDDGDHYPEGSADIDGEIRDRFALGGPQSGDMDDDTGSYRLRGVTRASGADSPGVDGPRDAYFMDDDESTGLIADYFEVSPETVREVLEELEIPASWAMGGGWHMGEGSMSLGDHITEAVDRRIAEERAKEGQ